MFWYSFKLLALIKISAKNIHAKHKNIVIWWQ